MYLLSPAHLDHYIASSGDIESRLWVYIEQAQMIDFSYLTESSSVYSANIEGNTMDLSSYQNAKLTKNTTKDVTEIQDLVAAYEYAQSHILTEKNFLHTHQISSSTLLIPSLRWHYRRDKVGVFDSRGLVYLAIEATYISQRMRELFSDIAELISQDLSIAEVLYYAAFIHLVFAHIHPFADGNGRSARLLEKWFIASKLGKDVWRLASEEFYKKHRDEYYQNINLWPNYYELDYGQCLPFLLMLPESL
jgi:Fic family protein